jgi:hypothetical protein
MSSWNRSLKSLDAEDGEKARKDNNRVAVTRAVEAHRNPDRRERRFVVMAALTTPIANGMVWYSCVIVIKGAVDMNEEKWKEKKMRWRTERWTKATAIKPMMLCTLSLGGDQDEGSHGGDVGRWGSLCGARGPGAPMSS